MPKKIILQKIILVASFIFFTGFQMAQAGLVINEIMYDLDGADIDWVEVYNSGEADADLTALKLLISNSTSNHGIVKDSGSEVLHAGDYGVIVVTSQISSFLSRWSNVTNIFTSSFSLPNETAQVEINAGDKNVPIDSVTYNSSQGAVGDGQSLQLIDGSWIASTPTPGSVNVFIANNTDDATDDDDTANGDDNNADGSDGDTDDTSDDNETTNTGTNSARSSTSKSASSKKAPEPAFKAKILANTLAFTGQPHGVQVNISSSSNENVDLGRAFWNFGDGSSLEQKDNFEKLYHTYDYPGDYVVFLEYYQSKFSQTPEATSKIVIKVVPTTVVISKVGDVKDFFVELTNQASFDMDVSNWIINANGKIFILPKNSVIISKKPMTISGKTTGFSYGDQSNLKLFSATGELVFDYSASRSARSGAIARVSTGASSRAVASPEISLPMSEEGISASDLEVLVVESGATKDNSGGSYLPMISSLIFIGASASAVYFLRQKRTLSKPGDDFKILDE
ncbi:hypothetical protein A2917_00100 [Candidatus Nomurabacteria bacterium RIFCSPLOWO2_01_FULL_42_17]|uniref:PKD domain-containing protein n=1 Tax=Candidatus Nomurabacteria bacterium RIFCSPLOWO2_01_FULL_42_17 TaxID=1801780 RepID=A0A1F6XNP0_9BACT|nr:MAG: hypothetical protein A2917_00100 [Candidatus Nomurabacteria bacterium RIFCSPLOWO2_01_FULL_42_17]